jgi:DNA ligase 1
VQWVRRGGQTRLYSRTGDDIGQAFPEILAVPFGEAVLDGELLIGTPDPAHGGGGRVDSFASLQKRINRKTATARLLTDLPAFVRLYDLLFDGAEDLRTLPFVDRRERLERWMAAQPPGPFDLSPSFAVTDWDDLAGRRDAGPAGVGSVEGVMLKRADSPYLAGRPKGLWFKWKRAPLNADCVLMYAQRGHGKRSSLYSDFTFGCWVDGGEGVPPGLVPVGKAYFGFTDAELAELDRFVRNHTTKRFGPVREVEPTLVLEIAFDGLQRSTRHRSGVAMRFPRIHRIRWDKPATEADRLDGLCRYLI